MRDREIRAAEMPHRRDTPDALDANLESTLGRFFFAGRITEPEYQAGLKYGHIILRYLASIDSPTPYGRGFHDLDDSAALQRKLICAQAREVLKDAARATKKRESQLISAVDRLCVYGEAPRNPQEMELLRLGLRALADGHNVVPISRPATSRQ